MKGDEIAAAREVVSELKVHGDFVDHPRRQPRSGRQPAVRRRTPRDPQRHARRCRQAGALTTLGFGAARFHRRRVSRGPPRHFHRAAPDSRARRSGRILARHAQPAPLGWMAEQARRITGSNLETRIKIGNAAEELAVLVTSFNELLSRLDQSFDTMRRFVADASHELRTPIAVIRGEADVALSQERSAAEYRESLGIILDEVAPPLPPGGRSAQPGARRRRARPAADPRFLPQRTARRLLPLRSGTRQCTRPQARVPAGQRPAIHRRRATAAPPRDQPAG